MSDFWTEMAIEKMANRKERLIGSEKKKKRKRFLVCRRWLWILARASRSSMKGGRLRDRYSWRRVNWWRKGKRRSEKSWKLTIKTTLRRRAHSICSSTIFWCKIMQTVKVWNKAKPLTWSGKSILSPLGTLLKRRRVRQSPSWLNSTPHSIKQNMISQQTVRALTMEEIPSWNRLVILYQTVS